MKFARAYILISIFVGVLQVFNGLCFVGFFTTLPLNNWISVFEIVWTIVTVFAFQPFEKNGISLLSPSLFFSYGVPFGIYWLYSLDYYFTEQVAAGRLRPICDIGYNVSFTAPAICGMADLLFGYVFMSINVLLFIRTFAPGTIVANTSAELAEQA